MVGRGAFLVGVVLLGFWVGVVVVGSQWEVEGGLRVGCSRDQSSLDFSYGGWLILVASISGGASSGSLNTGPRCVCDSLPLGRMGRSSFELGLGFARFQHG